MCDMRNQDRAEYRRLLEEIGEDYCPEGHYCIFKEFLLASHPSRRLLVQLKACDKFKIERSTKVGRDIGWDETLQLWVSESHAERFAKAYSDDKSVRDIYRDTMKDFEFEKSQKQHPSPLTSLSCCDSLCFKKRESA